MHSEVIDFWFSELKPKDWWRKDPRLDQRIRERFGDLHQQAAQAELFSWREKPEGRLAEIIVLDQFSRNIYRDDPRAFAQDPLALALAQEAVRVGDDQEVGQDRRAFLYMPYMHSESKIIHQQAVPLFTELGSHLEYEMSHKAIVDRFGRYPHRNKILGRESTVEEIEFLKGPGSSF